MKPNPTPNLTVTALTDLLLRVEQTIYAVKTLSEDGAKIEQFNRFPHSKDSLDPDQGETVRDQVTSRHR